MAGSSLLGVGWSVLRAPAFPTGAQIGLGIGIIHTLAEFGQSYPWSITIADEAGVPVIPTQSGQLQIAPAPAEVPQGLVQHRMPFAAQYSIVVPRPGGYSITVRIGN